MNANKYAEDSLTELFNKKKNQIIKFKLTKTENALLQKILPLGYSFCEDTRHQKPELRMPSITEFNLDRKISRSPIINKSFEPSHGLSPINPIISNEIEKIPIVVKSEHSVVIEILESLKNHQSIGLLRQNQSDMQVESNTNNKNLTSNFFEEIEKKIETKEIESINDFARQIKQLFESREDFNSENQQILVELEQLQTFFRNTLEKKRATFDINEYTFLTLTKYSKKIEKYAKGQKNMYKFQNQSFFKNKFDSSNKSRFEDDFIFELIHQLPSNAVFPIYENSINLSSDQNQPNALKMNQNQMFEYCCAKFYQQNAKNKNLKPSARLRKKFLQKMTSRKIKCSNFLVGEDLNSENLIETDKILESNSESSFLSGITEKE